MKLKAAVTMLALLSLLQSSSPADGGAIGVLVGLHHLALTEELKSPASSLAGGSLHTIWIPVASSPRAARTEPTRVADLLLPRRSGFWQAGLLATCAEEPYPIVDNEVLGTAASVSDYLWFTAVGRTPAVTLRGASPLDARERLGPCRSRNIRCANDTRTGVAWVWPEYVSLNLGGAYSCGAHPDGDRNLSLRDIDHPSRPLTLAQVLGPAALPRLRDAFESAKREYLAYWKISSDEVPPFNALSWSIERQPGAWRLAGWAETHRLYGYGFAYTADLDLSAVTMRQGDDANTLLRLKERRSEVEDAHAGPAGWALAISKTELLLIQDADAERSVTRVPISRDETVIMVEWAAGPHVKRWSSEVRKVVATGPVRPRVDR